MARPTIFGRGEEDITGKALVTGLKNAQKGRVIGEVKAIVGLLKTPQSLA